MRVAFYRASSGGLIDRLIDRFSGRGGFSHVELIFSNDLFFSSSGQDGGVRFKRIVQDRTHWEIFELPIESWRETQILWWAKRRCGCKYDWLGVLGFIFQTHPEQGRWFCSEICVAALQEIGLLGAIKPWKVSPNTLYLILAAARDLTKLKAGK